MKRNVKNIGLILTLFVQFNLINAQDIITLKTGDEVKVHITENTAKQVKYKKYDNLNGPTYSYDKSEIFRINYENGKTEVMADKSSSTTKQLSSKDCKNLIESKKDEFTGEQIQTSKTLIFKGGIYEEGYFQKDCRVTTNGTEE